MNQESLAPIISIEEFNTLRASRAGTDQDLGIVVATSGGFDPVHPGHLSCILESKQYGDTVVVIVNGDTFLKNKKYRVYGCKDTLPYPIFYERN